MADEALLDMPEIEDEQLPVEGEGEGTAEGAEGEAQGSEGEAQGEQQPVVTSLFQTDGKKLDPTVSKKLAAIKAENPALGKLLSKAVYRVAELDREFPGGLSEARELREKVEEFGGVEGIQSKIDGVKELQSLADYYMAGDPAFVEDMAVSSPESFAKLAPLVLQKYSESQPEAYAAHVGRVVYGDMQRNEIPLLMMRLIDVVGDNAKAGELIGQLNTYLGGFKALADKKVDPVRSAAQAQPKKDDLSKREEELRSKEWRAERDVAQKNIVNAEYAKALAGRKPDAEERGQIRELFSMKAARLADNLFKGWQAKAQGYIQRDDKPGYLRFMQSIYKRVAPEAMAAAVNGTMKGKAAAPVNRQQKPAVNGKPVVAAPAGFTPVAKEPGSYEIDYGRTTKEMIGKNQAVLKDGKKVQWR